MYEEEASGDSSSTYILFWKDLWHMQEMPGLPSTNNLKEFWTWTRGNGKSKLLLFQSVLIRFTRHSNLSSRIAILHLSISALSGPSGQFSFSAPLTS
jgi:hypothetical protein